jgi:hypothetical protein
LSRGDIEVGQVDPKIFIQQETAKAKKKELLRAKQAIAILPSKDSHKNSDVIALLGSPKFESENQIKKVAAVS